VKLVIGADHRGYEHKEYIKSQLPEYEWIDVGATDSQPSDYPVFAHLAGKMIMEQAVDGGVLLCATGIGMSIVANRHKGVYAALVWNTEVAKLSKEHDNANMLVLPSDYVSFDDSLVCIRAWASATFFQGKYAHRLALIDD
jgi:ribose 5-phosphate isomerase B